MSGLVVYDLEYTSWEGARDRHWSGPGEHREIVEIGAVRLDDQWREIAHFERLVRPRINPVVSAYFTALTGITPERVAAEGCDLAEALVAFAAFAGPDATLLANGTDADVIAENCGLYGLDNPFVGRTRDIHPDLTAANGGRPPISADLPRLFGLPVHGRGHTALADARNVAAALAVLSAAGRFHR